MIPSIGISPFRFLLDSGGDFSPALLVQATEQFDDCLYEFDESRNKYDRGDAVLLRLFFFSFVPLTFYLLSCIMFLAVGFVDHGHIIMHSNAFVNAFSRK